MGRARWAARILAAALTILASAALQGNGRLWATGDTPTEEADLRALVNRERAARGLASLAVVDDLVAVARRQSDRMASRDDVFHNSDLASDVEGWQLLGENVGTGATMRQIHDAFMASKVHRDVLLHPRFTELGVGVVQRGDARWVTQVFRQPEPQSTAMSPTTAPARARTSTAVATTARRGRVVEPAPVGGAAGSSPQAPPANLSAQVPPVPASSPRMMDIPAGARPGTGLAAGPLALPAPGDIPDVGLVAAALLLTVVGGATLTAGRHSGSPG